MNMKSRLFAVVALSVAFCTPSFALSLAEKQALNEWQKYVTDPDQSSVKAVQEKCGVEIPIVLDESLVGSFVADHANAGAYCDQARSKIASMCEDSVAKGEIAAKVKSVNCKLGEASKVSLSLEGGTLTLSIGVSSANVGDEVEKYLGANL